MSKHSNDQTTDIVALSQGFDEGYAAGIKEGILPISGRD